MLAIMQSTNEPLRIFICGRLALIRGDCLVPESAFPARQGRRIWAYLVLHRSQPVGRGDVAGAVWGDEAPDAWDAALNALVSRLRRSLAPIAGPDGPAIIGETGRYELRLPADAVVDFERARAALHRTDVLMRQGEAAKALAEARVATEIAARPFLPGEDGAWVEGQRQLLHSVRLHALEYTVEAELARGHADTAEREAEQLLALDPLHEGSHRLLMGALAARGNGSGVWRAFAACCRVLAAEGLAPSRQTEELARELTGQG
jgi:DNA-binding SARP family transcriptional activator